MTPDALLHGEIPTGEVVVFDDDLSPAQQRNLEREWRIAVIDRREVIIDIFADRASTREAVRGAALAEPGEKGKRSWKPTAVWFWTRFPGSNGTSQRFGSSGKSAEKEDWRNRSPRFLSSGTPMPVSPRSSTLSPGRT